MKFTDNHFRNALELFEIWQKQAEIQRKSMTYAIVGLLSTPIFEVERAKNQGEPYEYPKNWPYTLRTPLRLAQGMIEGVCCDYVHLTPEAASTGFYPKRLAKHHLSDKDLLALAEQLSQENLTMQMEEQALQYPHLYKK